MSCVTLQHILTSVHYQPRLGFDSDMQDGEGNEPGPSAVKVRIKIGTHVECRQVKVWCQKHDRPPGGANRLARLNLSGHIRYQT